VDHKCGCVDYVHTPAPVVFPSPTLLGGVDQMKKDFADFAVALLISAFIMALGYGVHHILSGLPV
jgi:hypothetical protein